MVLTASQRKLNAGDEAPYFSLKGIDGKMHSSGELDGNVSLVVFMCNHCPYVLARLGSIIKLQEEFKELKVVGINSNDPDYPGEGFGNMKKFAMDKGINFPYLIDETQQVAKSYGAACTPDSFLFGKNKRLAFHGRIDNALTTDGKATEQTMKNNIRKVMNGDNIEKPFEPSMGCSIKWVDTKTHSGASVHYE